jgi:acyl carrier protein
VTLNRLNLTQQIATSIEGFDIDKMRALIAEQLHVDITRVTDDASFRDDLGANWLDRLELMMRIEDQFADVEITDDDADQIKVVGDLISYIDETRSRSILI